MKRAVVLGFLLAVLVGLSTSGLADTFTTASPGINYAVNTSQGFFVNSTGYNTGPVQSYNAGSYFYLAADTGSTYSDAGIVAFFDGSLKLGLLSSVSVASTGNPVTVNLWLDTGGDGSFFSFNSSGMLTGLNGDSYGGASSSTVNSNTLIEMFGGDGAGNSYTLAALQAGVVPGITPNTAVALWIGLTNPNSANITSFTVDYNPLPGTLLLLGSGLVGLVGLRWLRKG
jgi:hypothetical protein